MKITRIKPPKYKVGKYSLNEYEVRNLQVEVAKGLKPHGIKVKDEKGKTGIIREDGLLTEKMYGYDITAMICLELLGINKNKTK
jgi:hypothetical protein